MRLEILTNGQCRPLAFRQPFPARHLIWHAADGRRLGIDAGYGPAATFTTWPEKLYAAAFRVRYGQPLPPLDDLLLTHHHLDHAGGVGHRPCHGPPLPPQRSPLGQLHHATFNRTTTSLQLTPLPAYTHTRFGFPAVAWHDLEVLHLPGHTTDHHGVYFPALHLLYVCDAVWWLRWLETGQVPRWAAPLQADRSAFHATFSALVRARAVDPTLRFRCAHDPDAPAYECLLV